MPVLSEVLATIQAVCTCITEILKFLQTDDGKKWVQQMYSDRQAWDNWWKETITWFKDLEK
jgi:hypothetical protein